MDACKDLAAFLLIWTRYAHCMHIIDSMQEAESYKLTYNANTKYAGLIILPAGKGTCRY